MGSHDEIPYRTIAHRKYVRDRRMVILAKPDVKRLDRPLVAGVSERIGIVAGPAGSGTEARRLIRKASLERYITESTEPLMKKRDVW